MAYFVFLRLPAQSDLISVYYPQFKTALAGGWIYRDFASSYAPAFPYLGAFVIKLWDAPQAFILVTIVLEAASLWGWLRVAASGSDRPLFRRAAVYYVTASLALFNVALDGQNQVWVSVFLAAAVIFLSRQKWFLSGLAVGASIICVKFLPLMFAPAFICTAKKKAHWTLGLLLLPILVYGYLSWNGIDWLLPFRAEAADHTSGNLLFVWRGLLGIRSPVEDLLTVTMFITMFLLATRFLHAALAQELLVISLLSVILLTLLLFSKKAYTNYLLVAFFPICLTAAAGKRDAINAWLFGCFNGAALMEPSLWFRWMQKGEMSAILGSWSVNPSHLVIFLICEFILIGAYLIYLAKAVLICRHLTKRNLLSSEAY